MVSLAIHSVPLSRMEPAKLIAEDPGSLPVINKLRTPGQQAHSQSWSGVTFSVWKIGATRKHAWCSISNHHDAEDFGTAVWMICSLLGWGRSGAREAGFPPEFALRAGDSL